MIDGAEYIKLVKLFYSFLESEFDFTQTDEMVNGNAHYDVKYQDRQRVISISYENLADYLLVIVFMLQDGRMPEYDDKSKTLHLNKLNKLIMPMVDKAEISSNTEYFSKYDAKGELERKLLKEAKELRLCLRHFDELQRA